ncbi:MAG: phytanoyl-CoA dioxygenase family protein [Gammaproteobacteria bacterium]|nr:phytanoyl-CoA dioxygenase family protein [Gammaproteobacteria bacterium]
MTQSTWTDYSEAASRRAHTLGNRGPVRLDSECKLVPEIKDAYYRTGFYVFTGVLDTEEIDELTDEFDEMLDNAPTTVNGDTDSHGRSSSYYGYYTMMEDEEDADAPAHMYLLTHPFIFMESTLRAYGHPKILAIAESLYGQDFVPFHEAIFYKAPENGLPTRWHQDGRTHWTEDGRALEQPDGSGKCHGYNMSVALSHCTAENCLWVVPGSQRRWLLAHGGEFPPITERLDDAVPMLLEPGDCGIVSRSALHGSYPNRSANRRVTLLLGFHKRDSAIGASTTNVHAFKIPGVDKKKITYSEEYVLRRARMIPLAIDARRQYRPREKPFKYRGSFLGNATWNEVTRAEIRRDGEEYWQQDITL